MFIKSVVEITITDVVAANRLRRSPVGITTHRTLRERWALVLKREGKTYYNVGGKEILSDALHPIILPKGCSYSWKCVEPGECLIIEFDALTEEDVVFPFEVADNSFIVNAFSKIEKDLHLPFRNGVLECKTLLYGILLTLVKSTAREYVPKDKASLVQPATEYITRHYYDSGITNDALSALCGISTVYFRKVFENIYGISPIRYLHNYRMQKAKDILCSDYESIDQVAQSVGYNSIYHFSKMFKSYTGISPTEYAKRYRK